MNRAPFALLVLVATVAACSTSPTAAPPTAAPPTATATPPTIGPIVTPATGDASRHADPALEALLPETLGAAVLTRESQRGTDLSRQSDALTTMLTGLGKTLNDFTVASAYSAAGEVEAEVGLWQIRGADPGRLMEGFITAVQASSTTKLTVSQATISGHAVSRIGASGQLTQGPLYAYVKDDMILFVQTTDPSLAEQALAKLP
jgi:hypothetical protein